MSSAKENILKRIRDGLSVPVPVPFPRSEGTESVYPAATQDNEIEFAEQFSKLKGRFVYCPDNTELRNSLEQLIRVNGWTQVYSRDTAILDKIWPAGLPQVSDRDLAGCDAAITGCELLIARTGSIVLSAALPSGRTGSVYAPVHICIARSSQLVYDLKEALEFVQRKYRDRLPSLITLATGPSRTADIEKTLVVGVHGPREVYVFLVDD